MEGNTFVNTVTSSVVRFKCFVFGLSSLLLLFGLLLLFSPHFQVLILSSVCMSVHHFRFRKYFIPLFVFMVMILMSVMILTMR